MCLPFSSRIARDGTIFLDEIGTITTLKSYDPCSKFHNKIYIIYIKNNSLISSR